MGFLGTTPSLSQESCRFFRPLNLLKNTPHLRLYFKKKGLSDVRRCLYIVVVNSSRNASCEAPAGVRCIWSLTVQAQFVLDEYLGFFAECFLLGRQHKHRVLKSKKSQSANFEISAVPQKAERKRPKIWPH